MRMRKKRHLESRLENAGGNLLLIEGKGFYEKTVEEKTNHFDWEKVFGNNNPIEVEIGCGKGQFVIESAKRNPGVNYVAIEKISNVIITACERAEREGVENVRFLNCDAFNLRYYFSAPIARAIYLNFSTPYPQKTYAGKRLTHPKYIKLYSEILCSGGKIVQKTDDKTLFEFSIESFSSCGYALKNVTLDLHNSYYAEGNIVTEYEKNFSDKGMPIYSLTAVKNSDNA
jgi:tRNA (guanine-N7-)-methyltransferase